jgi:hypothetical protein
MKIKSVIPRVVCVACNALFCLLFVTHANADWLYIERPDNVSGDTRYIGILDESNLELGVLCGESENDVNIIVKFPKYLTFKTQPAEFFLRFDSGRTYNAKRAVITDNEIAMATVTTDSVIMSELVNSDLINIRVVTTLGNPIGEKTYKNTRNSDILKGILKECG